MKIALFDATGTTGERIAKEALARGHQVTAVVRDPARLALADTNLRVVGGDVLDAGSVAATVVGHDAVISAIGAEDYTVALLAEIEQPQFMRRRFTVAY